MDTKQIIPTKKILKLAETLLLIADEIEGEVDYLQHFKKWKLTNQTLEEVEQCLLDLAIQLKMLGEELFAHTGSPEGKLDKPKH